VPEPPKSAAADTDPLARAREAMDRREYGAAAGLLRSALSERPEDVEVHYRLAVSASHLDRPDEAAHEFEWVLAHAAPDAPEADIARSWLASRTPPPAVSTPSPAAANEPERPAARSDLASLTGRAVGPDGPQSRLQLFLKGVPGTAVRDAYHVLRTDASGRYHFADVVPGEYMLTNAIAGRPAWRLRVSLGAGEQRVLDLSAANAASIRDEFPSGWDRIASPTAGATKR
jgi:hypothetical protein